MEISDRQRRIIRILVRSGGFVRVSDIAKQLGISPRTVRYDIDDIEYYLNLMQIELIRKPRVGIAIKNPDRVLDEMLMWEKSNELNTFLNKEERIVYLGLKLAVAESAVSSESLADTIGVSRSAILTDLKELGQCLEGDFDIRLIARKRYGYMLHADELQLRRLLTTFLHEVLKMDNLRLKIEREDSLLSELCNQHAIQEIRKAMKLARSRILYWIPYPSYLQVIAAIQVSLFRMKVGKMLSTSTDGRNRAGIGGVTGQLKEMTILATDIASVLDEQLWPEMEIQYLATELMKHNLKISTSTDKSYDPKLINTVYEMIRHLQQTEGLSSQAVINLQNDLIAHLDLTLEKLQLNIPNENQLVDEIKCNYARQFELAQELLKIFNSAYQVEATDNEAGFITMYLVKNEELNKSMAVKKVLVVCGSGRGASKLLGTRIKNNIPRLIVKDIVSVHDVEEDIYDTSDIDLLISTVALNFSEKPVIKVSPIITDQELGQISKLLFEDQANLSMLGMETRLSASKAKMEMETEIAHMTGMVIVEIASMLNSMHEKGWIEEKHMNQWGLTLHIVMAVPRWRAGSYNIESDIETFRNQYSDIFETVWKRLEQISVMLDLRIPEEEAIAIMRYLIS